MPVEDGKAVARLIGPMYPALQDMVVGMGRAPAQVEGGPRS